MKRIIITIIGVALFVGTIAGGNIKQLSDWSNTQSLGFNIWTLFCLIGIPYIIFLQFKKTPKEKNEVEASDSLTEKTQKNEKSLIIKLDKYNVFIALLILIIIILSIFLLTKDRSQKKAQISVSQKEQQIEEDTKKTNNAFNQVNKDIDDVDAWEKLKCIPISRLDCDKEVCTKSQPSVYLILDRKNKLYSRCDAKGCDKYSANFGTSGIYTNIQGEDAIGSMVKVLGKREYIEISTIGLGSILQKGSCEEVQ